MVHYLRTLSRHFFTSPNLAVLTVTWLICIGASVTFVYLLTRVTAIDPGRRFASDAWFTWSMPLWLLAGATLFAGPRVWLMSFVSAITSLVAMMLVISCYWDTEMTIQLIQARAAGRHMMICFRPTTDFAMFLAYVTSAGSIVVSLIFLPFPPSVGDGVDVQSNQVKSTAITAD